MGRQTQPPAALARTPPTTGPGRPCYYRTKILSHNPGPQSLRNFQIRFARGECSGRCRGAISIGDDRQSRITLEARDLLEKLNILVTGGAGFIGSHLVDALVEKGHRVRILDSLVEQVHGGQVPEHLNKNAEFIQADMNDAEAVSRALEGIDVVYHKAAEVGVGQSMYEIFRYVKANDLGTAVLLEEMIKRPKQFRKLVVASSMSIYGEGAYVCEGCNETIYPYLRENEQLEAQDWDFKCEKCGDGVLKPVGTSESKPLFPT